MYTACTMSSCYFLFTIPYALATIPDGLSHLLLDALAAQTSGFPLHRNRYAVIYVRINSILVNCIVDESNVMLLADTALFLPGSKRPASMPLFRPSLSLSAALPAALYGPFAPHCFQRSAIMPLFWSGVALSAALPVALYWLVPLHCFQRPASIPFCPAGLLFFWLHLAAFFDETSPLQSNSMIEERCSTP